MTFLYSQIGDLEETCTGPEASPTNRGSFAKANPKFSEYAGAVDPFGSDDDMDILNTDYNNADYNNNCNADGKDNCDKDGKKDDNDKCGKKDENDKCGNGYDDKNGSFVSSACKSRKPLGKVHYFDIEFETDQEKEVRFLEEAKLNQAKLGLCSNRAGVCGYTNIIARFVACQLNTCKWFFKSLTKCIILWFVLSFFLGAILDYTYPDWESSWENQSWENQHELDAISSISTHTSSSRGASSPLGASSSTFSGSTRGGRSQEVEQMQHPSMEQMHVETTASVKGEVQDTGKEA